MIRRFFHMLRYCRPYARLYLVGVFALILVDLFDTFTPKVVQWAIDDMLLATGGSDAAQADPSPLVSGLPSLFGADSFMGGMWVYALLYITLVGFTGLFRYFMSFRFNEAGITLVHDLRGRFFAHVQRLDAKYHDKSKIGELMSIATSDLDACRFFFAFGLLLGLDTALYFIMVPIYMMTISWKLMLASMLTLPLIPLIVSRLGHAIENRYEKLQEQIADLSERSRESYAGAKVVKSFTREENEIRSFAALSREYVARGLKLAMVEALEHPLLMLMLGLADLVVVVYGGSMVLSGEITIGGFVAFFQYLIRLSGPMVGLGWVIMLYQRGQVSMGRVEEVLNVKPGIAEPETPAPVEKLQGGIEVRNLTFGYFEGEKPALADVSFRVEPGRTLALVGPVGCGKTTLLNLIPRLYDPPAGTVFLDGHDVRAIPLSVLRTQIGAVSQETFLFSETIEENLALGLLGQDDEADPEWLRECARIAQVEEDVLGFPKGYGTMLGEKGVNLSGGQKQRVAIARAIARRPSILLLDDCLSAVDTNTEAMILRDLKRVMTQRTTLIVSHRLSTVEHADEILVLQQGRLTERGGHTELLRHGGYYADLWEKQQLEEELAGS